VNFNVTENARAELFKIRENNDRVRVSVAGGGCSGYRYQLAFESNDKAPEVGEKVFVLFNGTNELEGVEINEETILVIIDPKSSLFLDEVTLDYKGGLTGTGFFFINPKAKTSCGCGESFSPG
jgi:iron-sulfur cluster assembly accessory protein